jgi:serine/threonine protein phosphatase PrpC
MNQPFYFQYTDPGPRDDNQDAIDIRHKESYTLACIADGVGGGSCGSLASTESVKFFSNAIDNPIYARLEDALQATHQRIKELQKKNEECHGMATTFTACLIRSGSLFGVHVGDSRLCILRGNGIKQLTDPHTEAHRLFLEGKLTFNDLATYPRRNVLESAIGIKGEIKIQTFRFDLQVGDRVLLTTDGVHDVINKLEFRDLSKESANVEQFGKKIIELLKDKRLTDNVSFILMDVHSTFSSV